MALTTPLPETTVKCLRKGKETHYLTYLEESIECGRVYDFSILFTVVGFEVTPLHHIILLQYNKMTLAVPSLCTLNHLREDQFLHEVCREFLPGKQRKVMSQ